MDNRTGKIGENYTAALLEQRGWQVLERNYHSRYGEIDIIARDGQYIVFVEVKTRRSTGLDHPLAAVTKAKQQKLTKTALLYLAEHPEMQQLDCRFDVAGLTTDSRGNMLRMDYIENAFEGEPV